MPSFFQSSSSSQPSPDSHPGFQLHPNQHIIPSSIGHFTLEDLLVS